MDAFVAADSSSFSPSVGHIPKFHGRHGHSLPSVNLDDYTTDSRGNEEQRLIGVGVPVGTDDDHTAPCRSAETASPAAYDLREALLGADAFAENLSPSASEEDASGFDAEHINVTLAVDDLRSDLLPEAPSTESSIYLGDPHEESFPGSGRATNSGFTLTNYVVSSMASPLDTIDDFILASMDLEFTPATSCDVSKDFHLDSFDSTTGHLNSDLVSSPGFSDVSDYMTSPLGESSTFYESLLLQATNQDPMGCSIDFTDYSALLGIDFCLGAGADHCSFKSTKFEFSQ